ncbi:MAG: DUF5716 family protein [bacterium]
MNLFRIVPDNFFSLLASPNKSVYFDCLVLTFKAYEDASILGVDKKHVVEVLSDYLDKMNKEVVLEDDEEGNDNQSKAYAILRKFEHHGWIDTDVTNDYEELITFRDYAITVIEALMQIKVDDFYGDEEDYGFDPTDPDNIGRSAEEFKGYIYTIYLVLLNKDATDYNFVMDSVYKNTKGFMRELRKLDVRMKEYIKSIVDSYEIKDLMENLIKYKVELFDKTYHKLKTSDNINKYRLFIVNSLTQLVNNQSAIEVIASGYRYNNVDTDAAPLKAMQDIHEIIDLFNSLDDFISEIDKKNKTYLNSTIAKIQFLLNEEADITGKLNSIMKFITEQNKKGKMKDALKVISPLYTLNTMKHLNVNSLYTQRGVYKKFEPAKLEMAKTPLDINKSFLDEYKSIYTESLVYKFTMENMVDGVFRASAVLSYAADLAEILMVLFALIYADNSKNLKVRRLECDIDHVKYILKDFEIFMEDK